MALSTNEVLKNLPDAEQTILRMRGRNIKTMSSLEKDVLISSLSVILNATVAGYRPSATVLALAVGYARNKNAIVPRGRTENVSKDESIAIGDN